MYTTLPMVEHDTLIFLEIIGNFQILLISRSPVRDYGAVLDISVNTNWLSVAIE